MFNFYIKGRVIEFKIDEGSNDVYIKLKQDDVLLEKEYLAYLFPHQLDNKGNLNNDGTSDKQKDSKNVNDYDFNLNDKKYFCVGSIAFPIYRHQFIAVDFARFGNINQHFNSSIPTK